MAKIDTLKLKKAKNFKEINFGLISQYKYYSQKQGQKSFKFYDA